MDAERIDRFRPVAERSSRPELPAADGPRGQAGGTGTGRAHAGLPGAVDSPGAQAAGRVDVRLEPLTVRDGCAPDRIPPGRWPSDDALVRSEQFAVNEAVGQLAGVRPAGPSGLLAVHAPPGTGVAEVFGDLVAAIVTERARRIADLTGPEAAFGPSRTWGPHTVAAPAPELTGFEIVLAAPEASAPAVYGLPPIGTRWRDPAAKADYFASTARLADGVGAWAMLAARLGDGPANRAFAERWWRGAVRGTDVLFPAGESMAAALRRLAEDGDAVDWPAAVSRFRSAAANVESLGAERTRVAVTLTRLSVLEQAFEEASGLAETGQATLADLTAREPAVRAAVLAAEADRRTRLADLGALELGRPALATVTDSGRAALRTSAALSIAVAGGLRRGKNWRTWSVTRRELRAACAETVRQRDAAVRQAEELRAGLAAARETVARATAEVSRLAAELGPLAETVAEARQRWGDHVPDGPSQAETEDAALIEWRETSAPWADREYAAARADLFLAALELHKALIAARADAFAANLGALMDRLCTDPTPVGAPAEDGRAQNAVDDAGPAADGVQPAAEDPAALLAAWQSFFLVVPVVHLAFEAAGTLLAGTGRGSVGWLLAGGAERLTGGEADGLLGRVDRAVLASDAIGAGERVLSATTRYGTWLPGGSADQADRDRDGDGRVWVDLPLRVVRGIDRATVDQRNDQAYGGLLISDRD